MANLPANPGEALWIGYAGGKNHYNVGIGQGTSGGNNHEDFAQSLIEDGYTDPDKFFLNAEGNCVFRINAGAGRTSSNTAHPRSELRELLGGDGLLTAAEDVAPFLVDHRRLYQGRALGVALREGAVQRRPERREAHATRDEQEIVSLGDVHRPRRAERAAQPDARARLTLGERLRHDRVHRAGPLHVQRRRRPRLFLQHLLHRRRRRSAAERALPGDELVKDHAGREHVGAGVDREPEDLLGRHAARRPHHRAGLRQRRRLEVRDAEVGDLRGAVVLQEHVRGLDVAVDDPLLVRIVERVEDLPG